MQAERAVHRQAGQRARRALDDATRARHSTAICRHLSHSSHWHAARRICLYFAAAAASSTYRWSLRPAACTSSACHATRLSSATVTASGNRSAHPTQSLPGNSTSSSRRWPHSTTQETASAWAPATTTGASLSSVIADTGCIPSSSARPSRVSASLPYPLPHGTFRCSRSEPRTARIASDTDVTSIASHRTLRIDVGDGQLHRYCNAVRATVRVSGNLLEFSVFMYILNAGYPDTEMTYGYYS